MNRYKRIVVFMLITIAWMAQVRPVRGSEPFDIMARSGILVEETTGTVMYEKDADAKMYPASMTKILTALVTLEYLKPDEIVTVGSEINDIPSDSSTAGNFRGESLLVENLIRLVIIPSGNETSCTAAKAVALRVTNKEAMTYKEAEAVFSGLMNDKAKALGATHSNFVNPHGYYDENHYTTARDLSIICREALKNDLIRKIVAETSFKGNGAGENHDPTLKTQEYSWKTHNLLLMDGEYGYPYATGIKTGFTDEAGLCLAASAQKDGVSLISVLFDSPENGRYIDSKNLFEYGFQEFSFQNVQEASQLLDTRPIENHRLGDSEMLDILSQDTFTGFFSKTDFAKIKSSIVYQENYIAPLAKEETASEEIKLKAPIADHEAVGHITYTLDGKTLFEGPVLAAQVVEERTMKSDLKYYFEQFKENVFTLGALPYWVCIVIFIAAVYKISFLIKNKRSRNLKKVSKRY